MDSKKTNKNIITAILALALILVCAASVVSCNKESEDTMFPEYTGDIWTLVPEEGVTFEEGHIEPDSNDNIIDAGFFTVPVSDDESADIVPEDTKFADESVIGESSDGDVTTKVHVVESYDGIHYWPSDEFDESGYRPLKPVTKAVTD